MNEQQAEEQPRDGDNPAATNAPPEDIDDPSTHPLAKKLLDKIITTIATSNSLNILVTGLTGSGKSALINAFLKQKHGEEGAAQEGSCISGPCTRRVEGKAAEAGKQRGLIVWDTPGFKDGRGEGKRYLNQIECIWKHYQTHDLIVVCIKADTRYVEGKDNLNIKMMLKLHNKFGERFWSNAIIVVTFANNIETINPGWEADSQENKVQKFKAKLEEYKNQIKTNMKKHVGINPDIVDRIKVVPAGHHTKQELLDRKKLVHRNYGKNAFTPYPL